MAIKGQTLLLLVVFLFVFAASGLSISYQVNRLAHLELEYSSMEQQVSNIMTEWEALAFERWLLRDLGTYPRNASPLETSANIEIFMFYSNDVSRENVTSRFDQLAASLNVMVSYLELANQTNLNTLKDMCNKTGLPEPNSAQSYVLFLDSRKIIRLGLEQVVEEVFRKCVEYLSLSRLET